MAGQLWAVNSLGGFFANPKLSKQVRYAAQPMLRFRQFAQIKEDFGKQRGDTIEFIKIRNITNAGTTLVETATMPESNFLSTKGSCVVTEWGNSIPWTGKLETLSEYDVNDITMRVLRDDQAKALDKGAFNQFNTAKLIAVATATTKAGVVFTTNGTATATASNPPSAANVRRVIDELRTRKVPKYDGQHFICIANVNFLSGLYDSLEPIQQYTESGAAGIPNGQFFAPFNGEVGRYYGCRFIEENEQLNEDPGGAADVGEGIFFGFDAVMECVALPEELRQDLPRDFGRRHALAWYGVMNWAKIWDLANDAGEEHIIKMTSA